MKQPSLSTEKLLNTLQAKCHQAIDHMRRSSRAHKMLMAAELITGKWIYHMLLTCFLWVWATLQ